MQKVFSFIIESFYWFLTFLSPFLGFGLVGLFLITAVKLPIIALCILLVVGGVLGILLAERIRRKYGCSNYWGRILSTPDIWPTPTDEQKGKRDEKTPSSNLENKKLDN